MIKICNNKECLNPVTKGLGWGIGLCKPCAKNRTRRLDRERRKKLRNEYRNIPKFKKIWGKIDIINSCNPNKTIKAIDNIIAQIYK